MQELLSKYVCASEDMCLVLHDTELFRSIGLWQWCIKFRKKTTSLGFIQR